MITSLPNLLTLSRILVIPAIVTLLFWHDPLARWTAFGLFAFAGITDFFDGYVARQMNQISLLGRFLDPIADKLLVSAIILMLVAAADLTGFHIIPALIILGREILVSGLREFLAELRVGMPVSKLAKYKTTLQMLALGFLMVGDAGPAFLPVHGIGIVGIWLAALLTLVTGMDYLRAGLHHMKEDKPAE
ncbi:MAG: CDP-diacylglycerol--glycerol-3-phosphate 3-phosphatidyltransferase [Alphaproteobacteria bacterium]